MSFREHGSLTTTGVVLGVVFLGAGCATKKYVQNTVSPLEAKLDNTNKRVAENSDRITDLDRKTEAGITQAQSSADKANQAANKAQQSAEHAQDLAQQGISEAEAARRDIENIDSFKSVKQATILFSYNESKLTKADMEVLDSLVQTASGMKRYIIEAKGYTDNVGKKQYNLELSRKRAYAVVRYLTLEKQIPLVRVYNVGYGEDGPAASNKTRTGRVQNRRVEVSILAPQTSESQPQASTSSPQ
jgi:OmpA-OmpF porin, OOP family